MIPKLTLVGAGPGDGELITLKGIRALENADVVLYDDLANKSLLDYCPEHTLKMYVGKRAGRHSFPTRGYQQANRAPCHTGVGTWYGSKGATRSCLAEDTKKWNTPNGTTYPAR